MTDIAAPELSPPPRIVARCRNYQELVEALRRWFVEELGTTYHCVDALAGLPTSYAAKLFSPFRRRQGGVRPIERLGMTSLGPILGAGGLQIGLIVDQPQLTRVLKHSAFKRRVIRSPYTNGGIRTAPSNSGWFTPATGRLMRARGLLLTTPRQRRRWARQAITARWAKRKVASVPANVGTGAPDTSIS